MQAADSAAQPAPAAAGGSTGFAPGGTPAPVVQKLNAAFSTALDAPATRARLLSIGLDIPDQARRTSAYAADFVQTEIRKYEGPIRASGLVIE